MLAGKKAGLSVFEYTPLQIKQTLAGYGRADKKQMQEMVRVYLNFKNSTQARRLRRCSRNRHNTFVDETLSLLHASRTVLDAHYDEITC